MIKKELLEKIKDAPDNSRILFFDGEVGYVEPENVAIEESIKNPNQSRWNWIWEKWHKKSTFKKQGVAVFID